jgi:hypothetical protein
MPCPASSPLPAIPATAGARLVPCHREHERPTWLLIIITTNLGAQLRPPVSCQGTCTQDVSLCLLRIMGLRVGGG